MYDHRDFKEMPIYIYHSSIFYPALLNFETLPEIVK